MGSDCHGMQIISSSQRWKMWYKIILWFIPYKRIYRKYKWCQVISKVWRRSIKTRGRVQSIKAGCNASRQGAVTQGRVQCLKAGCNASRQGAVPQGRVQCLKAGRKASRHGTMPQGREQCLKAGCNALRQGAVPQGRVQCLKARSNASRQGAVPQARVQCLKAEATASGWSLQGLQVPRLPPGGSWWWPWPPRLSRSSFHLIRLLRFHLHEFRIC
jgi:hypothetical protein